MGKSYQLMVFSRGTYFIAANWREDQRRTVKALDDMKYRFDSINRVRLNVTISFPVHNSEVRDGEQRNCSAFLEQVMRTRSILIVVFSLIASTVLAAGEDTGSTKVIYPDTRRVDQTDDFFGVKVSDPYRWLEAD